LYQNPGQIAGVALHRTDSDLPLAAPWKDRAKFVQQMADLRLM
jgi:hypothetical protein